VGETPTTSVGAQIWWTATAPKDQNEPPLEYTSGVSDLDDAHLSLLRMLD